MWFFHRKEPRFPIATPRTKYHVLSLLLQSRLKIAVPLQKGTKKWMRLAVGKVMMRVIAISLVGLVMAVQLLFLYTRYVIQEYDMKDYPRMPLPVASHAKRHCSCVYYENISWSNKGGWVLSGKGKVKDEELDQLLKSEVERHHQNGTIPGMRVRIPANAPAGVFVNLTKRMEQAGVAKVRVAVFERSYPGL